MSGQDYGATALLAQTPPASSQAWPIKLFRFHKQISANLSSTLRSTKVGAPPMKPSHLSSLIPTPAVHPTPSPDLLTTFTRSHRWFFSPVCSTEKPQRLITGKTSVCDVNTCSQVRAGHQRTWSSILSSPENRTPPKNSSFPLSSCWFWSQTSAERWSLRPKSSTQNERSCCTFRNNSYNLQRIWSKLMLSRKMVRVPVQDPSSTSGESNSITQGTEIQTSPEVTRRTGWTFM